MKTYLNPPQEQWKTLTKRPLMAQQKLTDFIAQVYDAINASRDDALLAYAQQYDGLQSDTICIADDDMQQLADTTPAPLKQAIDTAYQNIRSFHAAQQQPTGSKVETMPGVACWQEVRAIDKVGLYVPGGSAPLISTVLMLGVPAQIAGCEEVVLCTPATSPAAINPAIVYAARLCEITQLYCVGGAQAIAAMAVGTKTIPKVSKIFGPGNQYVTAAKEYAWKYGVAIDMPAGPSEVLVVADRSARPEFVAADLLSQLEHGPDSQAVLVADSSATVTGVQREIAKQLPALSRRSFVEQSHGGSIAVVLPTVAEQLAFSNAYAPEHMILNVRKPGALLAQITNAGSVFVGPYSPESAGDYASGTNHTLPTAGWARSYSGLSVASFQKQVSFQRLTKRGIASLDPTIQQIATAEGLDAHARASSIRLT